MKTKQEIKLEKEIEKYRDMYRKGVTRKDSRRFIWHQDVSLRRRELRGIQTGKKLMLDEVGKLVDEFICGKESCSKKCFVCFAQLKQRLGELRK